MNTFSSFRSLAKTTIYRAAERQRWHHRQHIKRLKARIIALSALETVINAVYNNQVLAEVTERGRAA